MTLNYIHPIFLNGRVYSNTTTTTLESNLDKYKSDLVLQIESEPEEESRLLGCGSYYIFEDSLMDELSKNGLKNSGFQRFNSILRRNTETDELEKENRKLWVLTNINLDNFNYQLYDVFSYRRALFISEKALNLLKETGDFKPIELNPNFSERPGFYSNCFPVDGDIEDFILNIMPKHRAYIQEVQQKAMRAYREKMGLPPL